MARTMEVVPPEDRPRRRGRLVARRTRVIVKRVGPWSVLRFSLLFYFCVMLAFWIGLLVVYNFLGATVWVTTISTVGYLFGRHWDTLMRIFRRLDVAIAVLSAVIIFLFWRQYRKRRSEENG